MESLHLLVFEENFVLEKLTSSLPFSRREGKKSLSSGEGFRVRSPFQKATSSLPFSRREGFFLPSLRERDLG
jgi:hypothetical protein